MHKTKKPTKFKTPVCLCWALLLFAGSCGQSQLDDEFGDNSSNSKTVDSQAKKPSDSSQGTSTIDELMPTEPPPRPEVIDRKVVIQSIHTYVILPTFRRFARAAEELGKAVDDWVAEPNSLTQAETQKAWRTAMAIWQEAEVLQFGAAGSANRVGHENLREFIYSYPGTNTCRIDQEVERGRFANEDWITDPNTGYNVQGLDALEYLVFYDGPENSCSALNALNRDGVWEAFATDPDRLALRRAQLAQVLTRQVIKKAHRIVESWEPEGLGQSFLTGTEPFSDDAMVLDEVFAGMFYLDKQIKDRKLGIPLGMSDVCEPDVCPQLVESRYAHESLAFVIVNLKALKTVFQGGPTREFFGFDDLLVEAGASTLADDIHTKIDKAIVLLEAIGKPIDEALSSHEKELREAFDALKDLSDDFKGPFLTILSLSVPEEGAGDSD